MENERKSKKRTWNLGAKLSMMIAFVLIIILSAKTAYDAFENYKWDIAYKTEFELQKTKILAKSIEKKFLTAYLTASDMKVLIENTMRFIPKEHLSRNTIIQNLSSFLSTNKDIIGISVCFEPDAFDGKDEEHQGDKVFAENGRFVTYASYENEKIKIEPPLGIDDPSQNEWYTRFKSKILLKPFRRP